MTNPQLRSFRASIRRKAQLEKLLEDLCGFLPTPVRRFKTALTPEEYFDFEYAYSETTPRGRLNKKNREALSRYNTLLARADRLYLTAEKRYESDARQPKLQSRKSRHAIAESAYFAAYEYLENSTGIWVALDRDVECVLGDVPETNPKSAPRLRGSTSWHCLYDDGMLKKEIYQLKLKTLQKSLDALPPSSTPPLHSWNFSDLYEEVL